MKDYLAGLVRGSASARQGRSLAQEYLQARILGVLQRAGAMVPLAFHGGTDWPGPRPTMDNWRGMVYRRLEQVDWGRAQGDVLPFLEPPGDATLLSLETFQRLLT